MIVQAMGARVTQDHHENSDRNVTRSKSHVLVTGGAGFIGSHLVSALEAQGHTVTVLDNFEPSYDPKQKEQNLSDCAARVIRGDILDANAVKEALHGVDVVVHLAAKAGVRQSIANPLEYEEVNVAGTIRVLEGMRAAGCNRFVFASSSSVYGNRTEGPAHEGLNADIPVSPYAASKRAGELFCRAAHESWGVQVTALRIFTVYGPRQRPTMAISKFLDLAGRGLSLPMYGDGTSMRDYTWIHDVVAGFMAAVDRPLPYGLFNIGTGRPVQLAELIAMVGQVVGKTPVVERLGVQLGDVPFTHADISLAKSQLGWQPSMALRKGLEETYQWHKQRQSV